MAKDENLEENDEPIRWTIHSEEETYERQHQKRDQKRHSVHIRSTQWKIQGFHEWPHAVGRWLERQDVNNENFRAQA